MVFLGAGEMFLGGRFRMRVLVVWGSAVVHVRLGRDGVVSWGPHSSRLKDTDVSLFVDVGEFVASFCSKYCYDPVCFCGKQRLRGADSTSSICGLI